MGNAPLDRCFKDEWQRHTDDEEETTDESPRDDSSLEVAQQQEVEIINVEEQGVDTDILVPFTSSV